MDRVSPSTRSRNMSKIRSAGNKTTEKRLRAYLIRSRLSGWHIHGSDLIGRPDFIFPKQKVAVFVDGCFWHACPRCAAYPKNKPALLVSQISTKQKPGQESLSSAEKDRLECGQAVGTRNSRYTLESDYTSTAGPLRS